MRTILLFAATSALFVMSGTAHAKAGEFIANQYICSVNKSAVPKGKVRSEAFKAMGKESGQVLFAYENVRGFAVRLPARVGAAPKSDVALLKKNNANVESCEQDRMISIEAGAGARRGGGSTGEKTDWGVTRVGGGATYTGSGRAFVIDTGIDLDHPDLNVDTSAARHFVGQSADDQNGHGTHVAGTIAAIGGNNIGAKGVAAGARVVPVRVLGPNGSGSTSGVIAGVDYVAGAAGGSDVANMSLGGGVSTQLDNAVRTASANVRFALAAGNESDDADNHSPARVDGSNIYTIAAIAKNDVWASYSNYGSHVDWAEPGSSIYSTYKGGGYATLSGTSMATPHMAGLLLWGNPSQSGSVSRVTGETYKIGAR